MLIYKKTYSLLLRYLLVMGKIRQQFPRVLSLVSCAALKKSHTRGQRTASSGEAAQGYLAHGQVYCRPGIVHCGCTRWDTSHGEKRPWNPAIMNDQDLLCIRILRYELSFIWIKENQRIESSES